MICVRDIEPRDSDLWNRFVNDHPQGAVTHLYQWKLAVENAYGLEARYLGAFDESTLVAILPTVVIKRPFAVGSAVSLAFSHHAGWLIDARVDESKVGRLFVESLDKEGVHMLELRRLAEPGSTQTGEVTLVRKLVSSSGTLWEQLDAKVRNQVRKGLRSGLLTQRGKEQFDEFYRVYAQNTKFLGSPLHSRVFLRELLQKLPTFSDILTVRLEGKIVAAMFLLGYKAQLSDPWAASLRQYDKLCPNMLMYWEAFRFGCENGYSEFDMGRSQFGSNTYRFKLQWGTQAVPLSYESLSVDGASKHSSTDAYRSSKARIVTRLWKTLPLPIATWLGPKIRKYVP
jgi:FemAB-related protein (PEP-CTERM system-associated)